MGHGSAQEVAYLAILSPLLHITLAQAVCTLGTASGNLTSTTITPMVAIISALGRLVDEQPGGRVVVVAAPLVIGETCRQWRGRHHDKLSLSVLHTKGTHGVCTNAMPRAMERVVSHQVPLAIGEILWTMEIDLYHVVVIAKVLCKGLTLSARMRCHGQ